MSKRSRCCLLIVALASCGDGAHGGETIAGVTRRLAMSATHACALRDAGLYCWGSNIRGELGNGTLTDAPAPVRANLASEDIVEVAAQTGRTCVRRSTGEVLCWGTNEQGQIGDGTTTDALTPVAISGIDDARQLAIEDTSTCVLRADQSVSCWGGVSPDSPASGPLAPVTIAGLSNIVELRAGMGARFCALDEAGSIRCWKMRPNEMDPGEPITALAGARSLVIALSEVICAIVASDEILCHNLDNGVTSPLMASQNSVALEGTTLLACARRTDRSWSCWNVLPSMLESVGSAPFGLSSEVPLLEVAVGGLQACVLREDQQVACVDANELPAALRLVENLPR